MSNQTRRDGAPGVMGISKGQKDKDILQADLAGFCNQTLNLNILKSYYM